MLGYASWRGVYLVLRDAWSNARLATGAVRLLWLGSWYDGRQRSGSVRVKEQSSILYVLSVRARPALKQVLWALTRATRLSPFPERATEY